MFQCKCIDTNAGAGETVIFDMAKAAAMLEPSLLEKLGRGSVFQRFYPGVFNPEWDIADSIAGGSCWKNAFATTDPSVVERICHENGAEYEWVPSDDSESPSLITRILLPWYKEGRLILQTPLPSRFDNKKLKQSISRSSVAPKVDLLNPANESPAPFLISNKVSALMQAVWSQAVFVEWEQGDMLVIDNRAMAHARMNVAGLRTVVAVMAKLKETA